MTLDLTPVVTGLLDEFGTDVTITDDMGREATIKAGLSTVEEGQADGEQLNVGDLAATIAGDAIDPIPVPGNAVTVDGVLHDIVRVDKVVAAGVLQALVIYGSRGV